MGKVKDALIDREEAFYDVLRSFWQEDINEAQLRLRLDQMLFDPKQRQEIIEAAWILKRQGEIPRER